MVLYYLSDLSETYLQCSDKAVLYTSANCLQAFALTRFKLLSHIVNINIIINDQLVLIHVAVQFDRARPKYLETF